MQEVRTSKSIMKAVRKDSKGHIVDTLYLSESDKKKGYHLHLYVYGYNIKDLK